MNAIIITIRDIKAIKDLMNEVDRIKENSYIVDGYGSSNYNGKESLIDSKEEQVKNNIEIVAKILNVDYDTVVDMCYDFEFANEVLSN